MKGITNRTNKMNITNGSLVISAVIVSQPGIAIGIVGFITNLAVLSITVTSKHLRARFYIIINSSFVIGILFSSIYVIPTYILPMIHASNLFCKAINAIGISLMLNYNLHQCCISVDRFLAVRWYYYYRKALQTKHYIIIVSLIWLSSTLSQILPLFAFHPDSMLDCKITWDNSKSKLYYLLWIFIFWIVIPLLIVIASYSYIIYNIYLKRRKIDDYNSVKFFKKTHNAKAEERALQASLQMAILAGGFIISMVPFMATMILGDLIIKNPSIQQFLNASSVIVLIYPTINPVLYVYFDSSIREAVIAKVRLIRKSISRN